MTQKGENEAHTKMKSTRKASVKGRVNDVNGNGNVRKTKVVELFNDDKKAEMEAAVEWAIIALSDGESERMIMMSLQEIGWSAPQSRAIYELANGCVASPSRRKCKCKPISGGVESE